MFSKDKFGAEEENVRTKTESNERLSIE